MKKHLKLGIMFLTAIMTVACSTDSSTETENSTEQNVISKRRQSVDFNFNTAMNNVKRELENNPKINLPLDQRTLDGLLAVSGYDSSMKAEQVNQILDDVISAQEIGLEAYINKQRHLKQYTKTMVLKMVKSGYITDLERTREFKQLPVIDQNTLLTGNKLVLDLNINSGLKRMSPVDYGMVGVVGGIGIGTVFCGPPCGVVGGIIGGIGGLVVGLVSNKD